MKLCGDDSAAANKSVVQLGHLEENISISELLFGLGQHRQTLIINIYLYQQAGRGYGRKEF